MKKIPMFQKCRTPRFVLRHLYSVGLSAGLALFILPLSNSLGATIDWDGATSGDWATGTNWVGGVAPADDITTDIAQFTGTDSSYTVSLNTDRSVYRFYVTGGTPIFDFGSGTLTSSMVWLMGGDSTLISGKITGPWYQGYGYSNSKFTVDGPTAELALDAGQVGYSFSTIDANSNILIVQNGGAANFTGTLSIGYAGSASAISVSNNKVEVKGTGSKLVAMTINMGITGTQSSAQQASNNSLIIDNGGKVEVGVGALYVGRKGGSGTSSGNTVTIGGNGADSELSFTTASGLHVGFGGATNNVTTVKSQGTINAGTSSLQVYGYSGNTLRVEGGSINAKDGGIILRNDSGEATAGTMYLGDNGVVSVKTFDSRLGSRFGDKSNAANAGFVSGTLNIGSMVYNNTTTVFSVGDNTGTDPAIYNMTATDTGIHEFRSGITIEESDGWLTGSGTIRGYSNTDTLLTVNGVIAPGNSIGKITLQGDLEAGSHAIFNFEIAGLSSFDELLLTGDAAFGGTLNISLLDSFMPEIGNSFKLFDFASSSDVFDVVNLAVLDGDKSWDISNLYTNGTITVIPEPSALLLLVFGGLGIFGIRRPRKG